MAGTESTAFRAGEREELLPTLKQLQRTQPDAAIKWFAKGRLWNSPEEARDAARRATPRRSKSWRPGGAHVDPRERFKLTRDQKRARFKRRVRSSPAGQAAGNRRPAGGSRQRKKPRE